ncbi:VOC family protein [Tsuneonella mangrovi]|uniref:VOC family protein n=1 Tax=Tsuneonella mangrovi TaxID=1982042 RepID=UPI000BA22021|nr:VOC family protein [Tsuneonella mangrovi]
MLWAPLKPCQVAYYVEDARAAALAHNAAFGSGPFFVFDHVPLVWSEHRGRRVVHDHTSAYGQWGDKMIEFVQQHGDDPSAFHDLYPQGSGHFGFHHVASFVSRLDPAIAHCSENGMPLAQLSETATGTRYAFVDARGSLGHMIELYEPSDGLTDFYEMVADAARHWDGKDPIRKLN